jgi:zinc transport system substrate-binding protein
VWTAPPLVKSLARNILNGMLEIDPNHRSYYTGNYNRFLKEIDEIDTNLKALFKDKKGLEFMVFHPSWGYFADAYGLRQIPVEIEGKEPKPSQLHHLIEHARHKSIRVIFVQPQFSRKSAKTIARAIGGRVYAADPLAPDWAENLRRLSAVFAEALR